VRFVHYPEARPLEEAPGYDDLLGVWPEFLLHDAISNLHWSKLYTEYPGFQFLGLDGDRVVAEGNCVPVRGQPASWRDALVNAFEGSGEPDRVSALAIIIAPAHRETGLSSEMLAHMRETAAQVGPLFAPVRPTLKERHPLVPIAEYVSWRRPDGTHFDPWLRTHERLGGRILGPADDAMVIEGSREEWEAWTGLELSADGDHIVPGALVPVRFAAGRGTYREPCVWVEHRSACSA
jgi:GNAT superfamily N-acetyltransferase